MSVGSRLRAERKKKGISLYELARHVNISVSYLSQIERDERQASIKTLKTLSEYYNISMDYLLMGDIPVASPMDSRIEVLFRDLSELSEEDQERIWEIVRAWRSRPKSKS